ncbi:hypothetical protein [Romboutsia sp.]|uniref:hypothetical protein n=1 Tax=Romboutsia sp. TaxID=1965302 RepID=UPI002CD0090F|nr:hypothetical protein [Romboutsia sp.]HSQ87883.1 hypothetical protein [Romboutsia sp.]
MSNKYYKKQPYDNVENKTLVEHNELVETDVVFEPPKKDVVVDVLEVTNGVGLFSAEVTHDDFALVKGYIYKSIMYTTTKKEELDKFDNFQKEQMGLNEEDYEEDYEEVRSSDASSNNSGLFRGKNNNRTEEKGKDVEEEKEKSQNVEEASSQDGKDEKGKDGKDGKDEKGKDGKDEKGKDGKDKKNYVSIDGVIRHTTLSIPFEASIYIPGVTINDELIAELELVRNSNGKDIRMEEQKIKGLKEIDVVKVSVTVN